MLRYGCTRLEIGVQSVYEDVARDTYIRNQSTESTVYVISGSSHELTDIQ